MWHHRKQFWSLFLMLVSSLFELLNFAGNFTWELPDNGLEVEMLMYWDFINSIINPDPSLIQLSIPYKIFWKDLQE